MRINATKNRGGDGSNGVHGPSHRRNPNRRSSAGNAKLLPHRPSPAFAQLLHQKRQVRLERTGRKAQRKRSQSQAQMFSRVYPMFVTPFLGATIIFGKSA